MVRHIASRPHKKAEARRNGFSDSVRCMETPMLWKPCCAMLSEYGSLCMEAPMVSLCIETPYSDIPMPVWDTPILPVEIATAIVVIIAVKTQVTI